MRKNINGEKYRNAPPRVIERILASDYEVTAEGCWLWPKATTHDGYGITFYKVRGKQWSIYVHRLVYMHFKSDPGDAAEVDHTCHVPGRCAVPKGNCPHRRCFNPDHLEAVTTAENTRRSSSPPGINSRKTRCPKKHAYTPENTGFYNGGRVCLTCARLSEAAKRAAQRAGRVRFCKRCGADISARIGSARYCEQCNPPRWRKNREARHRRVVEGSGSQDHPDGRLF